MISLLFVAAGVLVLVGLARVIGLFAYDFFLYRLLPILAFAGGLYLMAILFGRI